MTLPRGYDTPVGELGDTLSGGEGQRLGLARAFLHDAPFMLLDEPTSNLDSLNEAAILKSLKEEQADKTIVLVSHRQSTQRIADTVYSEVDGRVSCVVAVKAYTVWHDTGPETSLVTRSYREGFRPLF